MVLLILSCENGTAHRIVDGLLDRISLGQEGVTVLVYSVIVVDGEVNMLKVKLVIWVL